MSCPTPIGHPENSIGQLDYFVSRSARVPIRSETELARFTPVNDFVADTLVRTER